jgi:hypothetical protein
MKRKSREPEEQYPAQHASSEQQQQQQNYWNPDDPEQQKYWEQYYQQYYAAYYQQQQQTQQPLWYDPSGNYNTVGKNLAPDVIAVTADPATLRKQQEELERQQEAAQKALALEMPKIKMPKAPTVHRAAGGEIWEDQTLLDWDPNDYRLFVGDLGPECTDDALTQAFRKYQTFSKARVVHDKRSGKPRGYGFVSFRGAEDYQRAFREMNGKYVAGRPIKLKPSNWKNRTVTQNAAKKLNKFGYAAMIRNATGNSSTQHQSLSTVKK